MKKAEEIHQVILKYYPEVQVELQLRKYSMISINSLRIIKHIYRRLSNYQKRLKHSKIPKINSKNSLIH